MSKERFLTILVPISDADAESTVYASDAALVAAVPPLLSNIDKIYKIEDGTYRRVWKNPSTDDVEYHTVTDREFPYLGNPIEIYDFTYDATRMGTAPTVSATVKWYAEKDGNGNDITLEGLWTQKCHVVFNGESLYLKQIPSSKKNNEDARYEYEMTFVSERVSLENTYFYDVVSPFITDKPVSESPTFSFFGEINEFAKRINANLIRSGLASLTRKYVHYDDPYYEEVLPSTLIPYLTYEQWTMLGVNPRALVPEVFGTDYEWQVFRYEIYVPLGGDYNRYLMNYIYENDNGVYVINGLQCKIGKNEYGDTTTSEEKLLTFDKNTIYEALQQIHDTYDLQYYITKEKDESGVFTGNTFIVIGDCEHDFADWDDEADDFVRDEDGIPTTENPFDYGVDNELLSKEKNNTTEKIVTRITGVGSSDNIPWHYPNPSPDGWIKPYYMRYGEPMQGVNIGYPTDEGETVADAVRFEKFLKNRIGVSIKRGVLKNLLFENDYSSIDGETQTPTTDFVIRVRYRFSTVGTVQTTMTLEIDYDQENSCCSKISARLLMGNFGQEVATYSSDETYENPNFFQTMFINGDGKTDLLMFTGRTYTLEITYIIPEGETPTSIYDYEGYYYPSAVVEKTDLPSDYTEQSPPYAEHHYYASPAHVGENFYNEQNLLPYATWSVENHFYTRNGVQINEHVFIPKDAGYSTDGTEFTAVSPLFRREKYRYKELNTGIIYGCLTDEICVPSTGQFASDVFVENPPLEREQWIRYFVRMKLRFFADDGWYIGSRKIDLEDYGLENPTSSNPQFYKTIFDSIDFKRVKWVTPQPKLMPEVFIKTDGERRFYNAHNYWDSENETLLVGMADTMIGEVQVDDKVRNPIYKEEETDTDDKHYEFENEYIQQLPHEHIEDFDDIKPSIEGQRNYVSVTISDDTVSDWANQYQNYFTYDAENGVFVNATSTYDAEETYYMLLRIDVVEEFAYDETDNDEIWESSDEGTIEGEYKHPYFFAKLRPLGFNLFDLALQQDMVLSMTTGNCGACNFKIGVDENTQKNPVQLWEYDVYRGERLENAEKVYDKGELRRYVDTSDLYYDTDGTQTGYVSVNNGLNPIGDSGEQLGWFNSSVPAYKRYKYSTDDVINGYVGSMKNEGNVRFEGDVVTSGRFIESQQDTSENYVWVALMKDTETYGMIMPSSKPNYSDANLNVYIRPKSVADVHVDEYQESGTEESTYTEDENNADKFVLINIRMPQVYIRRAERKLSRALVAYMNENNSQKFNFSINFSRIYLAQNEETDDNLNENSVLYVLFNNKIYRQYAKHYTYKMSRDASLPEISVDMNEELSVTRSLMQQWDERSKASGRLISSRFGAIMKKSQDKMEKTMIPKNGSAILSGNVIINDTNTSLVEMGGVGGDVNASSISLNEIDEITES